MRLLEKRREVGLIIDNRTVVHGIRRIFEQDWALTQASKAQVAPIEGTAEAQVEKPAEQAVADRERELVRLRDAGLQLREFVRQRATSSSPSAAATTTRWPRRGKIRAK